MNFLPGLVINNGDAASASYLTTMCNVSGFCSSAFVVIGNASSSASSAMVEITLGPNLTISGTGALTITGPLPVTAGGTGASSTAATVQTLTAPTVTVTESTGAAAINWALGSNFYLLLNANCTVTFSGAVDGQIITVLIQNTASNFTVTWPTINWPNGTPPTMTIGAHYDIYTFVYNATVGAFFGTYVQNY